MTEIIIECDKRALEDFQEFVNNHEDIACIEETESLDGIELIGLVIEKLPEIIGATASLIAILKSKNIHVKITENGKEIEKIEK